MEWLDKWRASHSKPGGFGVEAHASFDKSVVLVHAESQARATLDEQRDVFPEVLATKANQRIARSIGPIGDGDNFLHHRRVRARKRFDLLIVVVETGRTAAEFFGDRGVILIKSGQVSQLAFGMVGLERVTVVKVVAA